jgi:O-succinylbenzoic acid--CoA ligase
MEYRVYDFSVMPFVLPAAADEITGIVKRYASGEGFSFFTSGSTGPPREITLTHQQITFSARATLSLFSHPPRSVLLCLPVDRIGGFMVVIRAILGKMRLYSISPSVNPFADWPKDMSLPELTSLTPLQLTAILCHDTTAAYFRQLQFAFIGGAPLPDVLPRDLLSPILWETYSMTETASQVAVRKVGEKAFRLLPGFQLAQDVDEGLVISCPDMDIYKLKTNDRVSLLGPDLFVFRGRLDFVLNSGGVKVHPEEVERQLINCLGSDLPLAISAVPDVSLGDKVVLCVAAEDSEGIRERLMSCFSGLHRHSRPKDIIFLPTFPLTPGKKLDRRALKQKVTEIYFS